MLALVATGLLLGAMVTERRETEEHLREQRAVLSRMSRYATAGAMGVSLAHQISQPLSTVATYLHAARRLFRSDRSRSGRRSDALDKAQTEAAARARGAGASKGFPVTWQDGACANRLDRVGVKDHPAFRRGSNDARRANQNCRLWAPYRSSRSDSDRTGAAEPDRNAVDAAAERGDGKGTRYGSVWIIGTALLALASRIMVLALRPRLRNVCSNHFKRPSRKAWDSVSR